MDLGPDGEGAGAAALGLARQLLARPDFAAQGLLDPLAQPVQPFLVGKGLAFGILDGEDVQRKTIRGGEGLGIHDRAAGHGNGAGELREQAGIVGGIEHDVGDGPERVADSFQRQKFAGGIGSRHQPGIALQLRFVKGQPVIVIMTGQRTLALLRGEIRKTCFQRRLGGAHPGAATGRLVAAGHHVLGRIIEFAQQLALPAVPHARPHGTNVGHGQDQQQPEHFRRLDHVH